MPPLFDNLKKFAENTAAISERGERITYLELDNFSDKLYSKIDHRSFVFCLCENSIGSLAGYVSFIKHKVVPLLLAKDLDSELFNSLLELYKPEYIYLPLGLAERFSKFETVWTGLNYVLIRTNYSMRYPLSKDLALLLTTSGSTGSPKLVRQSYKNISANAAAILQYLELTETERPITTLAMNYTYGLSIINSHLLTGATVLLTSKTLMEKGFWDFFKTQSATSFGGVPYTYEMLKKLRFFKMDLPSLKTMTQAGGKLTPELTKEIAEFAESRGIRFFVMYGQTEATARMSYLEPQYAVSKCGSMGVAIPGGKLSIVDEQGREIKNSDMVGELVYRGDNVTLGYAERGEDLSKGDEFGGVLVTGDMAMRDKDGFFYITGRKKRFIKLYGNRINLDEAERLIKTIIPDCACSGRDDHMLIYITEAGQEQEVLQFISGKTGINHAAFEVKIIAKIPKNEAGKTVYVRL